MGSRVRRVAATVTLAALALSGCAADPDPSPPAGVDELTIPSPSPDPDDFVDDVDNPWLALGPGESLTLTGPTGEFVWSVGAETTTVGGVPVTGLDRSGGTTPPEDPDTGVTHLFSPLLLAQDDEGNVWQLEEGEPAGLFLPATPRYGDGWGTAYRGDEAVEVAEVTALEGDTLEVTTRSLGAVRADQVATYEKGVGLVRLETAYGVFVR